MANLNYTERPFTRLDATYQTPWLWFEATDLNGDGNVDLLVLGADYPIGKTTYAPQPGRLFLGDGKGGFALAPANLFPVNELFTVHPRKVLFEDFNGDGRKDVFVADHGWDTAPFPGQQNLLYLSTPQGGWRSATATLPQVADFTHSAAAADIDGDGDIDIMVGNGYNNERLALEAPYMLMNNGQGVFTRDDGRLPINAGQALDQNAVTHFPGTTFADVDRDGRPDLIVTADASASFDQYRQTTVFWNVEGRFDSASRTQLTQPVGLAAHIDLDAATADFDGDGLLDMVLIGTNGQPFYDGGFVQVFRGLGARRFEDVSSQVLPADGRLWASSGVSTGTPWPMWVKVHDFNGDLAPDFVVQYGGPGARQDSPIVWLNDGTGKFSVIKASAFAGAGQEWQFGGGLLVPSASGFQNYTLQIYPGSNGLLMTGRLSSAPYFGRLNDTGPEVLNGTQYTNWFVGGLGNDTIDGAAGEDYAVYGYPISNYSITIDAVDMSATISSEEDGVDTVKNVERFLFGGMSTPRTFAQLGDMKPPVLTDGASGVEVRANIAVTFSEAVERGNGRIVLKTADGTVVETFDVATSTRVGVNGTTVTVNPTTDLAYETGYRLEFEADAIRDLAGNPAAELTHYDFATLAPGSEPPNAASVEFFAYIWKSHQLLAGLTLSAKATGADMPATQATGDNGAAFYAGLTAGVLTLASSTPVAEAAGSAAQAAVNLQDAIAILKMIVGLEVNGAGKPLSPYQSLAADFDGNGQVALTDAIGVLKHVVGLPAPEPTWRLVADTDASVNGWPALAPAAGDTIAIDLTPGQDLRQGLVAVLSGDVDGSFDAGAQALRLEEGYLASLRSSNPELTMAQFGVYG